MKKIVAMALVVLMALFSFAPAATAVSEAGGFEGFLIGCCFGLRSAAAHNEGKELHWREWIRIVPLANIVGVVFDFVDGMNGVTTADLANRYGATYY